MFEPYFGVFCARDVEWHVTLLITSSTPCAICNQNWRQSQSIGLLMAYVDDVNVLLHHDNVHWLRGGKLNTFKAHILVSTSNESLDVD